MRSFEYGDQEIGSKTLAYAVASMMMGVGILTLPRLVAQATNMYDGWISIIIGGFFFLFFGWVAAKLAARFPKRNFFEFTSLIVSKPIAVLISFLFGLSLMATVALEARAMGVITKMYFFDRTPMEAIVLSFLLVVVYAVAGSRAALLRLNMMFLPIIVVSVIAVQLMNLGFFEMDNLRPFFATGLKDILKGAMETSFSFAGFVIVLFYISYMNRPQDAPKMTVIGMSIPFFLYLLIFTFCIAVFSHIGTTQIIFPTIEIAKEVEVPGGFFERFESLFFTIWTMTIFNTAAMALDTAIIAFRSIFPKINKKKWIFILSPTVFLVAMIPQDLNEFHTFGEWIAYAGIFFGVIIPPILITIAQIRGVKGNA